MKYYQTLHRLKSPLRNFIIPWSLRIRDRGFVGTGQVVGINALRVFNVACGIHLFAEYVGRPSTMAGPSMLPTLANEGELVIEDRLTYRLYPNTLSRGDIITLESPLEPGRIVCKRVIGLPGDTVCVDPTGERAPSTEHVTLPKNHIWISGDNAAFSRDSREYGPVSVSLVRGRIIARVWPSFTVFRNPVTFLD